MSAPNSTSPSPRARDERDELLTEIDELLARHRTAWIGFGAALAARYQDEWEQKGNGAAADLRVRILSLIARVERAEEDTARLDWMQQEGDSLSAASYPRAWQAQGGDVYHFTPVGDPDDGTPYRTVREAIDAARSPTPPSRPTPTEETLT